MVMAQAARLNLRMQKELKLLLTDPPPGASFPTLTDQHHGSDGGGGESSLTSIDALLQGPEGTIYSNGVFKIKIQIPERYPFQPPIVTFATPIYHPNIDNGGRICLDILNLPPKGMWQPSLNISTVLTSIGLLLSEPNPDDGLMHEASRDYKYNRQAFDQNARSMTEKYAQAGVTDNARGENGSQTVTSQSKSQTKVEAPVASICIPKHRKLSLESQGCSNNERDSGEEISKVPILNSTKNHIEIRLLKEATKDSSKYIGNSGKLDTGRYKLLPKVPVDSHSRNGESGNTSMSNQCSPVLKIQTTSDSPIHSSVQAGSTTPIIDEGHEERSHSNNVGKGVQSLHSVRTTLCRDSDKKPHSVPQCNISHHDSVRPQKDSLWSHSISQNKANPPKDATARKGYCSTSIRLKKRDPVGAMPLSERPGHPQNHDDKENLSPFRCLSSQLPEKSTVSSMKSAVIPESGIFCNGTKEMDETPKVSETAADDMVVLDSEDSDEENVPVRSRLCLANRCLSRKRKSGF